MLILGHLWMWSGIFPRLLAGTAWSVMIDSNPQGPAKIWGLMALCAALVGCAFVTLLLRRSWLAVALALIAILPVGRYYGKYYDGLRLDARLAAIPARAEAGDSDAQYEMAMRYAMRDGGNKDENQRLGLMWSRRAAAQGHAKAICLLASYYECGTKELPADKMKALRLYEKAGDLGFPDAYRDAADIYMGDYYKDAPYKDIPRAIELYKKGAMGGDRTCGTRLYDIYDKGEVVPMDRAEGLRWMDTARRIWEEHHVSLEKSRSN